MNNSSNGQKTVALCILDGWGICANKMGNAIAEARTPNYDRMLAEYPTSTLVTHGEAVGLPKGSIGNSEVGHLHIGAGRTVLMEVQRINAAIKDNTFFADSALNRFIQKVADAGGRIHVAGLVSDVAVHALIHHVATAANAVAGNGRRVSIHAFTDGRDSQPGLAAENLSRLKAMTLTNCHIETVSGRYFSMDRDQRWDRIEKAWRAIVLGHGRPAIDPNHAVGLAQQAGESDEFICPSVINDYQGMHDGDGIFFVNFRSDRMRQLAEAIACPTFERFSATVRPFPSAALSMVPYFGDSPPWIEHVFSRPRVENTLGEWVAANGRSQFRLAETEKYPHVTYFLNGGKEKPESGEARYMAKSPKVATYDLAPEMAAAEVAEKFVETVEMGFHLIVMNFANPDMVGHTGSLAAAIKACEVVDAGLGKAEKAILQHGGTMLVTADHGNCEIMIDPQTLVPHTAHTTNPVPIILVGADKNKELQPGTLSDLAPTILHLMELEKPSEMTGRILVS